MRIAEPQAPPSMSRSRVTSAGTSPRVVPQDGAADHGGYPGGLPGYVRWVAPAVSEPAPAIVGR
jgi:hypothetical protein